MWYLLRSFAIFNDRIGREILNNLLNARLKYLDGEHFTNILSTVYATVDDPALQRIPPGFFHESDNEQILSVDIFRLSARP